MNLPNVLTLSRFLLIPIYLFVFYRGQPLLAFGVVLLAGITDILDGRLARSRGQVTRIGTMLDPLADKTMMLAVIVSFLYAHYIPWEAALALIIRDVSMIFGSAIIQLRKKAIVPANRMGKLTTFLYYVIFFLIVLRWEYAISLLWGVIVFSYVTTFVYLFQWIGLNRVSNR